MPTPSLNQKESKVASDFLHNTKFAPDPTWHGCWQVFLQCFLCCIHQCHVIITFPVIGKSAFAINIANTQLSRSVVWNLAVGRKLVASNAVPLRTDGCKILLGKFEIKNVKILCLVFWIA